MKRRSSAALCFLMGCWVEAGNPPDKIGGGGGGNHAKLKLSFTGFEGENITSAVTEITAIILKKGQESAITLRSGETLTIDLMAEDKDGLVSLFEDIAIPQDDYDALEIHLDATKPLVLKGAGDTETIVQFSQTPILLFPGAFTLKGRSEDELVIVLDWKKSLKEEGGVARFFPVGEVYEKQDILDLEQFVLGKEGSLACLYKLKAPQSLLPLKDRDQTHQPKKDNKEPKETKKTTETKGSKEETKDPSATSGNASPAKGPSEEKSEAGQVSLPHETVSEAPKVSRPECPKAFKEGKVSGGKLFWPHIPIGTYTIRTFGADGNSEDQRVEHKVLK